MKQKLNNILINNLIQSDFLLFKNYNFWNYINCFKYTQINKKQFAFINPLVLLKNLKQYIRLLQFYKINKNFISNVNFFVKDVYQKEFIENFIFINKLNLNFKILYKYLILNKNKSFANKKYNIKSQLLFCIDQIAFKKISLYNIILNNNIFLIQEISSNAHKKNFGYYRIFNSMVDYKKLIFILVILNQILKKKKSKKTLKKKLKF